MDINVIQIRGGNSVNSKSIGSWTAGLDSPLVVKDEEAMKNLTADTVYRIFTVVVSFYCSYQHVRSGFLEEGAAPNEIKFYRGNTSTVCEAGPPPNNNSACLAFTKKIQC